MPGLKHTLIGLTLGAITASGLDRLIGRRYAGLGIILTFHHVRSESDRTFAENRLLEITPGFLETVLRLLRALGYEIIRLDEVKARLENPDPERPFAVLTADDGYLDNRDYALPILKRYDAPMTMFVCPGFADRTTPLWWLDLEDVVRTRDMLDVVLPNGHFRHPSGNTEEKAACFRAIYWRLRTLPDADARAVVAGLAEDVGIDTLGRVAQLCMDWPALRDFAREPLISIGAHSLTHPRLRTMADEVAQAEIADSKTRIERELGQKIISFAYPVGDPASAGLREFGFCRDAGMEVGLTTRPGVLYPEHVAHLAALPRLSINGLYQNADFLRALILGLPLHLRNRGRRLNIG